MKQMAESNNYLILNEYEKVFLKLKATSQLILIGEFYGDPDVALISDDETYCAVGGEGVIIYYLRDPFEEFSTNHKSLNQWKIWGRGTNEETMWVSEIDQIDSKHIRVELEDSKLIHLVINSEEIITTVDHPFYVKNQSFIKAGELAVGDELLDSNKNILLVENFDVELTDKPVKVYNF